MCLDCSCFPELGVIVVNVRRCLRKVEDFVESTDNCRDAVNFSFDINLTLVVDLRVKVLL